MNISGTSLLVQETTLILLAFVVYYFAKSLWQRFMADTINAVVLQRLTGAIVLSTVAVLFLKGNPFAIASENIAVTILLTAAVSVAAVTASAFRIRTEKDLRMYPHIRLSSWSGGVVAINIITWILYLLPYEFVLRGNLLRHSLEAMDLWAAFILNAMIYALAHAPQGWRETLYSFPFGLLLCTISYVTGSFWAACIIHIFLALSNDYFTLRVNPSMYFTTPFFNSPWLSIKKTLH